jgi:hypothetical protein
VLILRLVSINHQPQATREGETNGEMTQEEETQRDREKDLEQVPTASGKSSEAGLSDRSHLFLLTGEHSKHFLTIEERMLIRATGKLEAEKAILARRQFDLSSSTVEENLKSIMEALAKTPKDGKIIDSNSPSFLLTMHTSRPTGCLILLSL